MNPRSHPCLAALLSLSLLPAQQGAAGAPQPPAVPRAALQLPAVFGDHMVLQQQTDARLWGKAAPGSEVTARGSWSEAVVRGRAGADGRFELQLPTPAAGGPFALQVEAGGERRRFEDVLVGEVWLGSGQSNMEMPVGAEGGWKSGVAGWQQELAAADHPQLRLFLVRRRLANAPLDDVDGQWRVCSKESLAPFSATAYFFARELQQQLRQPVGIVAAAWGGTVAQAWTSGAGLEPLPEFAAGARAVAAGEGKQDDPNRPTVLWNGMLAPLTPMRLRGFVWYQGESNRADAGQYARLFPALIADWRRQWQLAEAPFLFVQIAPYAYRDDRGETAALRQAQQQALALPHTGMVVTMDIGDPADIHPKDKQSVGRRLALLALASTYGKPVACHGPSARAATAAGSAVRVQFEHAAGLAGKAALQLFELCGDDGRWVAATARIDGDAVVVAADGVASPQQVRYAFSAAGDGDLRNADGLPAAPFVLPVAH